MSTLTYLLAGQASGAGAAPAPVSTGGIAGLWQSCGWRRV